MRRPALPAVAVLAAALVLAVPAAASARAAAPTAPATAGVPAFSHVVEVFLENEDVTQTFENTAREPQLAALKAQGAYVPQYWGAGHASLDNYLAVFSGQQPVASTEADCAGMPVTSCLYPADVPTLATTLDAAGKSWKVYSEGMRTQAVLEGDLSGACLHAPVLSLPDPNQGPGTNGYATRHNPAAWFDSILQKGGSEDYCRAHSVDLADLATDERSPATLPAFSFVEPDTCHDGHDDQSGTSGGCAADPEGPTAPSGTAAIEAWLPGFVQGLTHSPAWDSRSLLVITFDESGSGDASGCPSCHDTSAGGRIGALFLGDQVKKGFTSSWQGDHYGLLRTVEAGFGLPTLKSLAPDPGAVHDGDPGVTPATDVFTPAALTAATTATTATTPARGTTATRPAAHAPARRAATRAPAHPAPRRTTAAPVQPTGTLAYTGAPAGLAAVAAACLLGAAAVGRRVRRRA